MFPPFEESLALKECHKIISLLNEKRITLEYTGKISPERASSGIMIGACLSKNDIDETVRLYTVSGNARRIVDAENTIDGFFVEPIVSTEKITGALAENDEEIHRLTDEINACEDVLKKNELKKQRKLLEQISKDVSDIKDRYL